MSTKLDPKMKAVLLALLATGAILIRPPLFMLAWNWFVVSVFDVATLTLWQSVIVVVIVNLAIVSGE